jgi:hypothetical protein
MQVRKDVSCFAKLSVYDVQNIRARPAGGRRPQPNLPIRNIALHPRLLVSRFKSCWRNGRSRRNLAHDKGRWVSSGDSAIAAS